MSSPKATLEMLPKGVQALLALGASNKDLAKLIG